MPTFYFEYEISTIFYGFLTCIITAFVIHQYIQAKKQFLEIKQEFVSAMSTVQKSEEIFNKKADALNKTLVDSRSEIQDQLQENINQTVAEMRQRVVQIQDQVNAQAETFQNKLGQHVSTVQAVLEKQVSVVNENLKTSIGAVRESIDVASTTGPVATVVSAVSGVWENPFSSLVVVSGCGFLARQIYVKYVRNRDGKEGLEKLSQARILTLFDALLAMCIVPTLLTHGWQTATHMWKAAKTGIDAIRTMIIGINMYQDLFGDDLKSQAVPAIGENFEKAIEMVEKKVEERMSTGIKETTKTIVCVHHYNDKDVVPGIHKCSSACKTKVVDHDNQCEAATGKNEATNKMRACKCEERYFERHPLQKYIRNLNYIIGYHTHYEECDMAKQMYATSFNATNEEMMSEPFVQMYNNTITEKFKTCGCYKETNSNYDLVNRDMYVLNKMKNSPTQMQKGVQDIWQLSAVKVQENNNSCLSDAIISNDPNGEVRGFIKKYEGKKMEEVIREEFKLPSTGFSDKVSYMFTYVSKHPALLPVVMVLIFAILLIMSWLTKEEPRKPWYNDKLKPRIFRIRQKFKDGEDVTAEDALLTKWVNNEGKASDAKRAAARLMAKASLRRKRPWWDYDHEREFDADEEVYADENEPLDDDERYYRTREEEEEDNILRDVKTADRLGARYRDHESDEIPMGLQNIGNLYDDDEEETPIQLAPLVGTVMPETAQQTTAVAQATGTLEALPPAKEEKLSAEAKPFIPKSTPKECPARSATGCKEHNHGKVPCRYNIKQCPHKNCYRPHTTCVFDKKNTCINKDHRHVVLTKKPKVVTPNLKKEAVHNGDRMQLTTHMLNSIGWATCDKAQNALNATKIWTGFYVSSHIFGEMSKPEPEDKISVEFWEEGKIVKRDFAFKNARHIGYDSLFWNLPFVQNSFKNKASDPRKGDKTTMVAYDSYEDFKNQKPKLDVSIITDTSIMTEEDNTGKPQAYMRCLTKNSTQSGNCAGPYYNSHGYVVGFHNAKLQDKNLFIGITKNMIERASGAAFM